MKEKRGNMSMSELEILENIASCLAGIRAELRGIGILLALMLFFKNMGGK